MFKRRSLLAVFTLLVISLTIILGNSATFNLGESFKGIPVKIVEVMMAIDFLLLAAYIYLNHKKNSVKFVKLKHLKILVIWILFGVLASLIKSFYYEYSIKELTYGWLYGARIMFYVAYTYCVAIYFKMNDFKLKDFLWKVVVCYVIVALIGFIQFKYWPVAYDFYNILRKFGVYLLNPDPHVNRLISTYLDPNFLSTILLLPISITVAFIIEDKTDIKSIIALAILITAEGLTVSRSGVLGLAIFATLLLLFLLFGRNKLNDITINVKVLILIYIIVMCLPIVIYIFKDSRIIERIIYASEDPSALARVSSWQLGVSLVKDNFFIGIGYNMIGFYTNQTSSITSFGMDSSLLMVAATTGIIGLFIFLGFITSIFRDMVKIRKENFYIANTTIAVIIASVIASFFNNLLFYPLWLIPFLLIVNCIIIYYSDSVE